jgi:hypothetical protein
LGRLFRAKFWHALHKIGLLDQVPAETWTQEWVVHCQPVGNGISDFQILAGFATII